MPKLQPERVGFSYLPKHKAILETNYLIVNDGEFAYKWLE